MGRVYVIMGVAGSGKSSIGRRLATALGASFYDGDDFHPPANVAKMAAGQPLVDADRAAWLSRLRVLIVTCLAQDKAVVLAASALKRAYRAQLRAGDSRVQFIFLQGSYGLIQARMAARRGHFMPAALLRSQFATLEPPGADEALLVGIDRPVDEIVALILAAVAPDR
jgi:gluconokinase